MKKALITGITGQDGANIAEHLGDIEEQRFIALIQREPFDYTKWREGLDEDLPIETISRKAMELRKKTDDQQDTLDRDSAAFPESSVSSMRLSVNR